MSVTIWPTGVCRALYSSLSGLLASLLPFVSLVRFLALVQSNIKIVNTWYSTLNIGSLQICFQSPCACLWYTDTSHIQTYGHTSYIQAPTYCMSLRILHTDGDMPTHINTHQYTAGIWAAKGLLYPQPCEEWIDWFVSFAVRVKIILRTCYKRDKLFCPWGRVRIRSHH